MLESNLKPFLDQFLESPPAKWEKRDFPPDFWKAVIQSVACYEGTNRDNIIELFRIILKFPDNLPFLHVEDLLWAKVHLLIADQAVELRAGEVQEDERKRLEEEDKERKRQKDQAEDLRAAEEQEKERRTQKDERKREEEKGRRQQEQSERPPTPTFASLKSKPPKKLPKIPKLVNSTFLQAEHTRAEGEVSSPVDQNLESYARPTASLPTSGIWEGLAEKKDEIRVYK